jgi:CRISPR-associated protein Csx3
MFYNMSVEAHPAGGDKLTVGFGSPATNAEIVSEVVKTASETFSGRGGVALRVNGPASLPVAFVLSHAVAHLYGCVAVWDPKLSGYVVAISHGGPEVGSLLPE